MVPTLNIQLQQILDTSKDTSASLAQGVAVMAKQEEVCIKWSSVSFKVHGCDALWVAMYYDNNNNK